MQGDENDLDEFSGGGREAMPFLDHLEELRWALLRCLGVFVVACLIVALFISHISTALQFPLNWAYGSAETARQSLITVRPMGVFSVLIQVCFLGGLAIALPFMIYFISRFIAPGLTPSELRLLRPGCAAAFVLFVAGAALSFFVVLPMSLAISIRFNNIFGFELLWTASDYYSLVVWMTLAIGLCFEFPLVIVILVYLKILPVEKLVTARRFVFVLILIFAAVLTPGGDPISLTIMSLPMYALYELSIWFGRRIERKRAVGV